MLPPSTAAGVSVGQPDDQRRFAVVIHDVCPAHAADTDAVADAVRPWVGRYLSAAVTPCWHGASIDPPMNYSRWITSRFCEVLLHGWTHQRNIGAGLVSFLTDRADEFSGLTPSQAAKRLQSGQQWFTDALGTPAAGFIPPAWRRGPVDAQTLADHGLRFLLGYNGVETTGGRRIPVSTITWDVGRFAWLGRAAELTGWALARARPTALVCIAVHPVDVERGFLPRVVQAVEMLHRSGYSPTSVSQAIGLDR